MKRRIGVNGFGRIGRYVTRLSLMEKDFDVAVVNDLADIKTLAHLFKYDSVHGKLGMGFEVSDDSILFENGKSIVFTQFRDPSEIPWAQYDVELVLESTGLFRTKELAEQHLSGGAKKVIISAPARGGGVPTVVLGVNDQSVDMTSTVLSNASCTTNSAAPMMKVIHDMCEIESAFITTVHSYTSDQRLHDAPHSDLRRARAAAESIVPTSTGAAKALAKVFPDLEGKIGGAGIRVPVPDGSLTDLTLVVKNPPSEEEIRRAMKKASETTLSGILEYTDEPLVSVDIIGNPHSCIYDAELTSVIGNMVKVVGWYDNEAGYSNRLVDLINRIL